MKYDWNIENLKYLRKVLNRLKECNDEEIDFDFLLEEIECVNEMLRVMRNPHSKVKIFDEFDDNKYFDKNKLVSNSRYNMYLEILPYIHTFMSKQHKKISKYENNYEEIDVPRLNSTKDLISLAYEVYESLPTNSSIYREFFLEYTNPRNNILKLINNEINGNLSVYGYIYFFYDPIYKPYIIMTQGKNIEDISILCHEVAHAIFYNPSVTTKNRSFYLGEVEGYYFEYLTRKYLKQEGYDISIINELEYRRFITVYESYLAYYMMHILINKYKYNKKISKDKVISYIISKMTNNFNTKKVNEAYINFCLNLNSSSISKYFMSYLTYLDLEAIDKKDPELAFHMLKEVCKIEGNYISKNLRNSGITFMDDGCKNLEKKIKHMNRI